MREIPLETWGRREHFNVFSSFDQPYFGMCAPCELTSFYAQVREQGHSFTASVIYVIARAANAIPEFRQRLREGRLVEHEVVHPSTTLLTGGDLFSFCTIEYTEDFALFAARAAESMARVREHPSLADNPGADDLLFISPIPWVSFTSFAHPIPRHPPDSVPRFAWGKRFEEGGVLKMPLSVHAHHALIDGLHMGRFYEHVQELLSHPLSTLSGQ